jgi:hypothetical protein
MKTDMSINNKKIFLLIISIFIQYVAFGQPLVIKTVAEDDKDLTLKETIYKYMYDTVQRGTFSSFEKIDINGNLISRSENNTKPAFIYYFTTSCKACHTDLTEILPELIQKFKGKIDFFIFTPASEEQILEENLNLDMFSIMICPKDFFKTGFPVAYLLNCNNDIVLRRRGGGTGTKRKETLDTHQEILNEWFFKVSNK